jgi:hypothetical protein
MLSMVDLTRLEVHCPGKELEKLKAPFANLNPAWFTLETTLSR